MSWFSWGHQHSEPPNIPLLLLLFFCLPWHAVAWGEGGCLLLAPLNVKPIQLGYSVFFFPHPSTIPIFQSLPFY